MKTTDRREPSRTLLVQIENRPEALERVLCLVRRRGFPVRTLGLCYGHPAGCLQLTLELAGGEPTAARVRCSLEKLIPVLQVEEVLHYSRVQSLALMRVRCLPRERSQLLEILRVFGARLLELASHSAVVQISAREEKIDELLEALEPFGVLALSQSGQVVLPESTSPVAPPWQASPCPPSQHSTLHA